MRHFHMQTTGNNFSKLLTFGNFPSEWKKANVVPTSKKTQCIKNYCPFSLLFVCRKVSEPLLYNNMFSFFSENDLILPKQSGFRLGDSCTNQLLSIAHEILWAFDDGHEVRGVFLHISKAFDSLAWRLAFQVTTKPDIRRAYYSNKRFLEL